MNTNVMNAHMEKIRAKLTERRKAVEQVRSFNVRRLQTDVKKITKQELEFTKKLLEEIVPVKVMWNEDAAKRLREMLPFSVEFTAFNKMMADNEEEDVASTVSTSVSEEELKKQD